MKIISLDQGTTEWLKWRQDKITATAASVLTGHNPWQTSLDLWNDMQGISPPKESNPAMKRGTELEPVARKLFEEQSGLEFIPICCESDENPWQAASLDGWNEENKIILEIKCPGEITHQAAVNGIVPDYYRDQIMHQFAVTGAIKAFYVSYRPEHTQKLAVVEVKPDLEYINTITEIEKEFYFKNYVPFVPPDVWKFKRK